MRPFVPQSTAAQVAAYLREEIVRGGLKDELPGHRLLAEQIGVNHKTLRAALGQLEDEGLVVPQGSGRRCRIQLQEHHTPTGFRVCILPFEDDDHRVAYHFDILNRIERIGHTIGFAETTLTKLQFDVKRVERFVRAQPQPLVSRIVRWTDRDARGKTDHRITFIKTEFVEGGTIGQAPVRQTPGKS